MAVATDVTKQVVATKKVEEAEERARLAIESAELGTFEVNLDTGESLTSPRMAEIFNVEINADRMRYVSAIYKDDLVIRNQAYKRAEETRVLDYECRVLWKDGSLHWVRVKGRMVMDEEHKIHRLLGVVQDITEQKTFAETLTQQVRERTLELETKNKELERSNANLEEFAHAASHDLKEPIRKIMFFTELLKGQLKEKIEEADTLLFERIETASSRMKALIEDMLHYSHVSHRPPEKEEVDLAEKMRQVLEDLEVEIDQKGAVVTVGQLPHVRGYGRQLQQLFQNLLSNALKYHKPDQSPMISITAQLVKGPEISLPLTELEKALDYYMIEVSDNGIGFDQAYADKIFQVFQRLHARNEYSGTGVGLSIVKKVIENHGGKIQAVSSPGEGAAFKVYLPK
jgi:hypothetical protein